MFKDRRVLRRQELDAFLATAVSPMLIDTEANQDMKVGVWEFCVLTEGRVAVFGAL